MAGGKGKRLLPLTEDRPKGLIPVGGSPILDIIIRQLSAAGFRRVTLCVSHFGDMIRRRFAAGEYPGVAIDFSVDRVALGTAAPLRWVEGWDTPALVMNGDVLTTLDFAHLYQEHVRSGALLTVAAQRLEVPVDLGVLQIADGKVRGLWEKPRLGLDVSSGIYVVSPGVRDRLDGGVADMTDLILRLVEHGDPVTAYEFGGEWHDIGTPDRYERAQQEFADHSERYVGPKRVAGQVRRDALPIAAPRGWRQKEAETRFDVALIAGGSR
ncbi:nucleotidyltransferase family protein [Marinactinospora rubrisoli]|uniref:NDP-sugar synthase n=1 Tax=Marinactinospora rubrisoli TaxID=2715399 RepID=A0ABW2KF19_9ACTN